MNLVEAKRFFAENDVRYVPARFVNVHVVSRTKVVSVEHFEHVVEEGVDFAPFAVGGLGFGR